MAGGTQLDAALRSEERAPLAARVAVSLGFGLQGADLGTPFSPDPDKQPALQLALQGHAVPSGAVQLGPPLGEPPGGLLHAQAAAALREAAGGAEPAGAHISATGEAMEKTGQRGHSTGRKGTSSSPYWCSSRPSLHNLHISHALLASL